MADSIESYEDFLEETQGTFDEWCSGEKELFDEMRTDGLDDDARSRIETRLNDDLRALADRAQPSLAEKLPESQGPQLADWVKRIMDAKGVPLTDNLSIRPDRIEGKWGFKVMFRW